MSAVMDKFAIKTKDQVDYKRQEGKVQIKNPNIASMENDELYHIALSSKTNDLKKMFGDVKFVCFGGSPSRMEALAMFLVQQLNYELPAGQSLCNIVEGSDRYVIYKSGPVLSVSHGMGMPSLSIIFHEIVKLLHHAEASDVTLFRIGTCGGLGLEPGTVVITEEAVDYQLQPYMEVATMGKKLKYPSCLDRAFCEELYQCALPGDEFKTIVGKTMCTDDFYEGQARLDGAFCDYSEEDKMAFLNHIHGEGVRNIEMESLCFAAYCHRLGLKGAVLCVTLLDRLRGDQITTPHSTLSEWQLGPQHIVARYIKKQLGIK